MSEFKVHGTPEAVAALFAALDRARSAATAAPKRGQSNLGAYAKSEDVMIVARQAIAETGLSVSPADSHLDPEGMVLERGYVIGHALGGWFRSSMSWPVLGRPDVSKGTGSTETMAFSYFLRTLLMMPRMERDDMDNPKIQTAMRDSHTVADWRSVKPAEGLGLESLTAAGEEGAGSPGQDGGGGLVPPSPSTEAAPATEEFDAEQSRRQERIDAGLSAPNAEGLFDE